MARWIRLSRADWLHLNKLLQRDQRRRDQAHERYCQQHGGQAPRQARKMFGTLQPACVVDLHTGAMYAVASEAGWWWQSVDERQFAWWFYLGPEELVVLKQLIDRDEHERAQSRQRYLSNCAERQTLAEAARQRLRHELEAV